MLIALHKDQDILYKSVTKVTLCKGLIFKGWPQLYNINYCWQSLRFYFMIIILKPYMHLVAEAPPRDSNILNLLSADIIKTFLMTLKNFLKTILIWWNYHSIFMFAHGTYWSIKLF